MNQSNNEIQLPEPIYRPELVKRFNRGLYAVLSAIAWTIWLYLFLPLVTLMLWTFGYKRFSAYLIYNPQDKFYDLMIYALIIVFLGTIFIGWALYNFIRFRGKERRSTPKQISKEMMVADYDINLDQLSFLQQGKIAWVYCDNKGNLTKIEFEHLKH